MAVRSTRKWKALKQNNTKSRRLKAFIKPFIYLLIGFLLSLIALPYGIRAGMEWWLHDVGFKHTEIEDINFNPFTRRLEIESVRIGSTDEAGFVSGKMSVVFYWWPLWQGRF